jgi:histidine ammonia-lyase
MMAAAQAVDLRGDIVLAPGTAAVHAKIRSVAAPLHEDRPLGPDAEILYAMLSTADNDPTR